MDDELKKSVPVALRLPPELSRMLPPCAPAPFSKATLSMMSDAPCVTCENGELGERRKCRSEIIHSR